MKTLKEELQEIIDTDSLNKSSEFICVRISEENRLLLSKYRGMASNYAKEFVDSENNVWWNNYKWRHEDGGIEFNFVISEKYRFIQDLINILP